MSFRRLGLLLALPTMVGLSLAACGTEDDAASGPSGGNGQTAGSGGTDETGGTGGNGASGGTNPEGGMGGREEPGPGGAGGDSAGGAGGDSAGGAGGDAASGAGGEGGAPGPVACHNILQAFDTDPGGSMGKYLTPSTGPVQSSSVEWDGSIEGVTSVGAGKLNATFGAFSEQAQLSIYFPAATHWPTCNTKMHAKVKLISAVDLSHVNGVSLSINSGNATSGRYSSQFVSTTTWMMDTWYELELPFATASYQNPANTLPDFNDVNSMGVMIHTKSSGTTPVPTTLYVDDIWVE